MNKSLESILTYLIANHRKKFGNKLRNIAIQIHYVSCGIKPGFLWDFGCGIDFKWIENLVHQMNILQIINSNLIVIQIADELFIINRHSLENRDIPVFIDVTSNLDAPQIIADCRFEIMHDWIREHILKNHKTVECLSNHICLTSLIGFLIGYPVVYWLDTRISDDNCLGNVAINVFQSKHDEQILLTSFSVPKSLVNVSDVERVLQLWNDRQVSNGLVVKTFETIENVLIM